MLRLRQANLETCYKRYPNLPTLRRLAEFTKHTQVLKMAVDALTDEDEQYDSANDSDFAPDGQPDVLSSADEADEDDDGGKGRKRKQPTKTSAVAESTDDLAHENSGDEAIIAKGKKKLKRAKYADDEGNDGGLIKTRAQRAAE